MDRWSDGAGFSDEPDTYELARSITQGLAGDDDGSGHHADAPKGLTDNGLNGLLDGNAGPLQSYSTERDNGHRHRDLATHDVLLEVLGHELYVQQSGTGSRDESLTSPSGPAHGVD